MDNIVSVGETLSNINYYRLSAYMLPFKQKNDMVYCDNFIVGTTWDNVYDLYKFDRKLRLLLLDAIERIEVAVRTQIAYTLSMKYGSHWQDNSSIFKEGNGWKYFDDIQKHIADQLKNNLSEVFIKHYREKYTSPINPPSWMCVEILYFNQLSRICDNLKDRKDVTEISKHFALPPEIFCSWLHTLNYIRNLCAHHSRLWNRDIAIVPLKLKFSKTNIWISNPDIVQRKRMYYVFCMISYLLKSCNSTSTFNTRLKNLFVDYPIVNLKYMGFPDNWEEDKFWR